MIISFEKDIKRMIKDIDTDITALKKSAIPTATTQATNRTVTGVRTDATKEIKKETGIKSSDIRKELKVSKASKNNPSASVNARTGKAKNLINFVAASKREPNYFNSRRTLKSGKKGKYKARGVKARAWGKTKTYDKTFIGRGKGSGATLVFARTSDKRTPLKSILGPSVRNTFDSKPMQAKLKRSASTRFDKEFDRAMKNQINRAIKRRG